MSSLRRALLLEAFPGMFAKAPGVLSQEDHLDGKKWKEIERVWYVRITDWDQLAYATSFEYQIQNDVRVKDEGHDGLLRVRKTLKATGEGESFAPPIYSLIAKVKEGQGAAAHNDEAALEVTGDFFDLFSRLSSKGMRKDRYHFPVKGSQLLFEVDCFLTPEYQQAREQGTVCTGEKYFPWAKIDLELPDENVTIPDLPIQYEELIAQTAEKNPDIDKLYDQYFLHVNQ